jgi:hypothetical protein
VRLRDERHRTAIDDARAALARAANREAIVQLFVEWWRHPGHKNPDDLGASNSRPSVEHLVARLGEFGCEDLAAFAGGPWMKQTPPDAALWQFATLLGESFVGPFVTALRVGNWREPQFFGLDSLGAWEAFDIALRDALKTDVTAIDAALGRLRLSVDDAKRNPAGTMPYDDRHGARLRERARQYQGSPQIDEVWERPSDTPAWPEYAFLWDVLLYVRPAETMALLATMPHPLLMRSCLRTERFTARPKEIANLIATAPVAFVDTSFQVGGAVAVLLLELACAAIESIAHSPDGSLLLVDVDKPELLSPAADKCGVVTEEILQALFSRPDAIALAWAWLEHMVSHMRVRGVRAGTDARLYLNLPMLVIHSLAARLQVREDYLEWIKQRQEIWQINRLCAVVAVAGFTQAPNAKITASILEWALLEGSLAYPGMGDAMANPGDVVATIGGEAICTLEDAAVWFKAIWERLRPIREQNWRMGIRRPERNTAGELCTLWGLAALESSPPDQRRILWTSVEIAIRDAWQTDIYTHAPNWSKAFFRLFKLFDANAGHDSESTEKQLSQALLPYITADSRFLDMIVDLRDNKWSTDLVRDAVAMAGFDLRTLTTEFLDMNERVFKLPQANRDRVERYRRLAEDLRTFKCIYCLQERDRRSYTKVEHVLPQSFGTFDGNLTLIKVVCDECNQYFGNNLEIFLARDTYEGQLRFTHGVKDVSEFKELARSNRVAIKHAEGEYFGVYVSRRYSTEKGAIEVTPLPQVGFLVGEDHYEYFLLDSIPSLAALKERGFSGDRPRSIHGLAVDPEVLERLLTGRGIPFRASEEDSPTDRPDSILCEFEGTIDHVIRRAVAKISFNYLAYWQGADFLHGEEFDMARRYIRHGTLPDYPMISIDEVAILEGEPIEGLRVLGHIITTAWTPVHSILAQVSLFNWLTYRISLTKEIGEPAPEIRRGHVFDVANRKIHELGSRPLDTLGA